jgi:putative manganese efflux pump
VSALIGLFFVSVSLGLSNFAASIGIGLSGVDAKTRLQTGLVFGFFEAAMPIVGLLIGQRFAGALGMVGHYLGAGLLMLTGLYAIFQAYREQHQHKPSEKDEQKDQRQGIGRLLLGSALRNGPRCRKGDNSSTVKLSAEFLRRYNSQLCRYHQHFDQNSTDKISYRSSLLVTVVLSPLRFIF